MRQQEKAEPMTDIRERIIEKVHSERTMNRFSDYDTGIALAAAREMAILIRERLEYYDLNDDGIIDDLVALLTVGGRAEGEKDVDCAGLIHQAIPDMAGTEPRLNSSAREILQEQVIARLQCERDAYKRDLDLELDGRDTLRKKFGARDDETFFAFIQRLALNQVGCVSEPVRDRGRVTTEDERKETT